MDYKMMDEREAAATKWMLIEAFELGKRAGDEPFFMDEWLEQWHNAYDDSAVLSWYRRGAEPEDHASVPAGTDGDPCSP